MLTLKELVISCLLSSVRNLFAAWDYTRKLSGSDEEISKQVEAAKNNLWVMNLPDVLWA
ncbi:MAG: hypothetical protein R3E08_03675 [Thiotrichaceae bacterium]